MPAGQILAGMFSVFKIYHIPYIVPLYIPFGMPRQSGEFAPIDSFPSNKLLVCKLTVKVMVMLSVTDIFHMQEVASH